MSGSLSDLLSFFSGGSNTPGNMGPTDTFAAGSGPGNLPMLPSGWNTGASNMPGGVGGIGGLGGTGLGLNIGTGQLALGGLSALSNLWSSFQTNSLAKKQLDASTSFANANLANQISSYNTNLSDREAARGKTEGLSQDQINQYIAANRLSR